MLRRVVIVGGGFGGLSAVRALRNTPVRVTLIDKRNYHLFRPMLYQVATGLLSADEVSGPLRSIFRRQKNVDVLLDEVTGINSDQRIVHLTRGDLAYEFLILATGIQNNYFGHDEWRRFAPGLESLDDADVIRSKILRAFERAEEMASVEQAGTEEIRCQLTFALVGAGAVGVEMAGTLAEISRMALAHDFRHIDPTSARVPTGLIRHDLPEPVCFYLQPAPSLTQQLPLPTVQYQPEFSVRRRQLPPNPHL